MSLTFYPVEENSMLQRLRQKLSPFLKAIQKCSTNTESNQAERENICDEVINTASSNVDNRLRIELNEVVVWKRVEDSSSTSKSRRLLCSFELREYKAIKNQGFLESCEQSERGISPPFKYDGR